ncbi:hypothetical protein JMUB7504_27090 [Staphylococcus aureus]
MKREGERKDERRRPKREGEEEDEGGLDLQKGLEEEAARRHQEEE